MKHKRGFNPLSRTTAHRRALHRNMVTSLFKYERITTTKEKAMEIRRTAEKLITRAKIDTVHNRRQAAKYLWDKDVLNKLFTNIGPRMKDRNGGYTRVLKIGFRDGDAASVAILELVDYDFEKNSKGKNKATDSKTDAGKKAVSKKASKKESDTKTKKSVEESTKTADQNNDKQ